MKSIILCDIDGTIAILGDRDPYNASTSDQDQVNLQVATMIKLYKVAGIETIFLTGREYMYEKVTRDWLAENKIPYLELIMRPDQNTDPAHVFKEEALLRLILPHYKVLIALDDFYPNIKMYKANGLQTWQVHIDSFYEQTKTFEDPYLKYLEKNKVEEDISEVGIVLRKQPYESSW